MHTLIKGQIHTYVITVAHSLLHPYLCLICFLSSHMSPVPPLLLGKGRKLCVPSTLTSLLLLFQDSQLILVFIFQAQLLVFLPPQSRCWQVGGLRSTVAMVTGEAAGRGGRPTQGPSACTYNPTGIHRWTVGFSHSSFIIMIFILRKLQGKKYCLSKKKHLTWEKISSTGLFKK